MGTFIVGIVVFGIVTLIVVGIIKDRKAGKGTCGCNCGGCPMSGKCHSKDK